MLSHFYQSMNVAVGGGALMKKHAIFLSKIQAKQNTFAHQTWAYGASPMRLLLFGNTVKLLETICQSSCPGAIWGPGQ